MANLKCKIGIHKYGDWHYLIEGSCDQKKKCIRCGKERYRKAVHLWGSWYYPTNDSCRQERRCIRCSEVEEGQERHIWGDWKAEAKTSCINLRICIRCGKLQDSVTHNWGEWHDEHDKSCSQIRICHRCKKRETRAPSTIDHNWGGWKYEVGVYDTHRKVRFCQKCNDVDEEYSRHSWTEWMYESPGAQVRRCTECDAKEIRLIDEEKRRRSHQEKEEREREKETRERGIHDPDEYYRKVLSLDGEITTEKIRKSYKERIKEYHPDGVATKGQRLKEIAEEETKRINAAYAYFRKKYNF